MWRDRRGLRRVKVADGRSGGPSARAAWRGALRCAVSCAGAALAMSAAAGCATPPRTGAAQVAGGSSLSRAAADLGGALLDSGKPGPTILVLGGVHGDEPSGAAAARELASGGQPSLLPRSGRLVVISEGNPEALAAGERSGADDVDMNRAFPGAAPPRAPSSAPAGGKAGARQDTAARAAAIYGLALRCDLSIDLHEEGLAWAEADLPTIVFNPSAAELALDLVEALGSSAARFAFTGGSPRGSLEAELERAGRRAILVEAPARLPEAERVRLHLAVIGEAESLLGMR